jgi:rhodanese-related sulfurtransferase
LQAGQGEEQTTQLKELIMSLSTIEPSEARRLLDSGALLIDVREADEHAREKIPGARHLPLSKLDESDLAAPRGKPVIFHCKSGARTKANAPGLAAKLDGTCEAFILEGGLDAWRKAGLPVVTDRKQPLELQRQVQIGAGSLALAGTLLGLFVSPWFFIVPGFVGTGLIVAGVTGFCGMARILMRAPWNRSVYGSPA